MDNKYKFPTILHANNLYVKRERGELYFSTHCQTYNERHNSVKKLITMTCAQRDVQSDFPLIRFCLCDKPTHKVSEDGMRGSITMEDGTVVPVESVPMYTVSTETSEYANTYPDAFFLNWPPAVIDYEHNRIELMSAGLKAPHTNALGWLGSVNADIRRRFVEIANSVSKDKIYYRSITWDPESRNCSDLIPPKFMSLKDQVLRFKYLIDMRGQGYSARTKIMFFCRRPIFLVDTPFKEFFYEYLEPWKHYVPVKRDLSDLVENIDRLESDRTLYKDLVENAWEFGQDHLTRASAFDRYALILNKH